MTWSQILSTWIIVIYDILFRIRELEDQTSKHSSLEVIQHGFFLIVKWLRNIMINRMPFEVNYI